MPKPKLSVILPVYNRGNVVGNVIESLLNQTFRDFELIIINDASTDNSAEIINIYAQQDPRIKVITNKKNLERCISRNIGIDSARGEYIAITDSDDISFSTRFAKQVVYLDQHPECYLVGARAEVVDEEGRQIGESFGMEYDGDISKLLIERNRLVHSSVMFRNTGEFLYREKFRYSQDYDFFLQMVAEDKEVHLMNEILVQYAEKKDIVYNEYRINQVYFAELAKYLYHEKTGNMKDWYEEIDTNDLEKYVPEKIVIEMQMKKAFFTDKDFKKARKLAGKLIEMDPSIEWRVYYLDTFFRGSLRKIAKPLKRWFKYRK